MFKTVGHLKSVPYRKLGRWVPLVFYIIQERTVRRYISKIMRRGTTGNRVTASDNPRLRPQGYLCLRKYHCWSSSSFIFRIGRKEQLFYGWLHLNKWRLTTPQSLLTVLSKPPVQCPSPCFMGVYSLQSNLHSLDIYSSSSSSLLGKALCLLWCFYGSRP